MTKDEPTFLEVLEGIGVPLAETQTGAPLESILRYFRTLTEDVDDTSKLPAPRATESGTNPFDDFLEDSLGSDRENPFDKL